jgi:repressor LexA
MDPQHTPQPVNSDQTTVRPTKRQYELLQFIEDFIAQHGYSPSYREIMKGLNYTSVATVSLHVNNLINRGHLRKRGHSARSLELISPTADLAPKVKVKQVKASEEKWLVDKVELYFSEAEKAGAGNEHEIDRLYVLTGALRVLGLDGAANAYTSRLAAIKKASENNQYPV